MNIITSKPKNYVSSYLIKYKESKNQEKVKMLEKFKSESILKIKLKDKNYVPNYQIILNDIKKDKNNKIIKIDNNNELVNNMASKKETKTDKIVKKRKRKTKEEFNPIIKSGNINLNFNLGDRIFFRNYKEDDEKLNSYIVGNLSEETFIKEYIERENNSLIGERDYNIDNFKPRSINGNNELRFCKTYINDRCVVIFNVYGEYLNRKKTRKNLIFEVVPLDLFSVGN